VFDCQGDKVIVPTYVDDLHITAKTTDVIQQVKEELGKHFKLHDLSPTKWFLVSTSSGTVPSTHSPSPSTSTASTC
jgi:Reverse transcriptase (RNA-dependent DNA polymerase)